MPFKIAVVVGSIRAGSTNRKVAEALTQLDAARDHTFTFADISGLPLYTEEDDEAQAPEVKALKSLIAQSDSVIFATPEYNRSMPGVLKNAIDHGSRPYGENSWLGKPAAVFGVSPSAIGTAMAQQHLRNVIACLGMPTLTQPEVFLQWKDDLLTEEGTVGEGSADFLGGFLEKFLDLVALHAKA